MIMKTAKVKSLGLELITPEWPAPENVKALMTTRTGGVSVDPYDSMNLGTHVGDLAASVEKNRDILNCALKLPCDPIWLNQTHSTIVADHQICKSGDEADAIVSHQAKAVCAIMTADCLPVLMCDKQGSVVAAAHAGWRGLQAGILEKTVKMLGANPDDIIVWLGAAISQAHFEVGLEVREAFISSHANAESAFLRSDDNPEKWFADIYELAKIHLGSIGVLRQNIYGGGHCTYSESTTFYSYRREAQTGRMAALIWKD